MANEQDNSSPSNQAQGLDNDKPKFLQVPLQIIIKYGDQIPFDIFLKLSESKMVRISNAEENVKETIAKYVNKGVKEIYAPQKDFSFFMEKINREITSKFFGANISPEEKMDFLKSGHTILKTSFQKIGISESSLTLARNLARSTNEIVKSITQVDELYAKFKNSCQQEFIRGLFVSALATSLINTFEWQTEATKERATQAILLRDIMLSSDEINQMHELHNNPEKMSDNVFNHPTLLLNILTKDNNKEFSTDFLAMIEQHHERPESKGYPKKSDHKNIILLTSIIIISDEYISRMIEHQFQIDKKPEVIEALREEFKKGNYRKAFLALEEIIYKPYRGNT